MAAEMLCTTWARDVVGWEDAPRTLHNRPAYLVEAKENLDKLDKEYIQIIDAWEDGKGSFEEIGAARERSRKAQEEYSILWNRWQNEQAEDLRKRG